jgi:hypothetical protein
VKKRIEATFYLILVACCIGYIYSAFSLRIGGFSEPGAGLIPLLYGIAGLILSSVLLLAALRKPDGSNGTEDENEKKSVPYRKLFLLLVTLIVYLVLFQIVDFLLLTFALMLALAKIFGLEGWIKPLMLSVVFVAAVYVIFIWGFVVAL